VESAYRLVFRELAGAPRKPQAGDCEPGSSRISILKKVKKIWYEQLLSPPLNGWSSCPTKSVPAGMIENSVLDQLQAALRDSGTREQLNVPEALWQSFAENHHKLVRALVKNVSYDGTTGAVSLDLTRSEDTRED
jgi:hypothetical protein